MTTTMTDYQKQATDFLESTNTAFFAKYLKTGKYFTDDKEERDIYEIELLRAGRSYKFNFGQSINCSGEYLLKDARLRAKFNRSFASKKEVDSLRLTLHDRHLAPKNVNFSAPTAYDILASLTKYEVGTFENFCGDYGYDTDSKAAEKTYNAVREEYYNIARLFNESELEQMREIN